MTALETAIAEVQRDNPDAVDPLLNTILTAVASGDLITREAADARAGALLREAAKGIRDTVMVSPYRNGMTAVYQRGHDEGFEAAAQVVDFLTAPDATAALDRAVKAAREEERERCAKICDEREKSAWEWHSSSTASDLAEAIRAIAHEVGQ